MTQNNKAQRTKQEFSHTDERYQEEMNYAGSWY